MKNIIQMYIKDRVSHIKLELIYIKNINQNFQIMTNAAIEKNWTVDYKNIVHDNCWRES